MKWLVWLLAAALLWAARPAAADELRPGYLELTQQDAAHWQMVWKAPMRGATTSPARPAAPAFCTQSQPDVRVQGAMRVAQFRLHCRQDLAGAELALIGHDRSFPDVLVRIAPLDRPIQAGVLSAAQPTLTIAAGDSRNSVARTYSVLGIAHILAGYDHLLFVVALTLLLHRGWVVVQAATAFTVAHSLTLAGTTLGLFAPPATPVEALIALSIMFLAVEIVKQDPAAPRLSERAPWMIAFLFGLIHGFGFAGALNEIGLPQNDLPLALLMFNLGVELGQLAIVAATFGAVAIVRRYAAKALRPATQMTAYGIGTIASFWFLERLFG